MVESRAAVAANRAHVVALNDRRCPVWPESRRLYGAFQIRGAGGAPDQAVHMCGSESRGCQPRPTAGSRLSPNGFGFVSLGGFDGKPATDADCCREAIARQRCLLRPHRRLAARFGLSPLRTDRGDHPRSDRQRPPCRRIRSPRRPRRRGDRAAAWSTHNISTPHGCRPRRQKSIDRRGRRCGPVPSRRPPYHRRAADLCRGASRSQGHRSASACC